MYVLSPLKRGRYTTRFVPSNTGKRKANKYMSVCATCGGEFWIDIPDESSQPCHTCRRVVSIEDAENAAAIRGIEENGWVLRRRFDSNSWTVADHSGAHGYGKTVAQAYEMCKLFKQRLIEKSMGVTQAAAYRESQLPSAANFSDKIHLTFQNRIV